MTTTTNTTTTMTTGNSADESSSDRVYNVRYSQRPQVHRRSWLPPQNPPPYSPNLKPPPYEEIKSDNRLNAPLSNQHPASPPPPYQSPTNQIGSTYPPPSSGFDTGGVFGYNHDSVPPNVPPPTYGATTPRQVVQGQRFWGRDQANTDKVLKRYFTYLVNA